LKWLVDLEYDWTKVRFFSGVTPGKVGEVWKPICNYETVIKKENNTHVGDLVSLIELLQYENKLVSIINNRAGLDGGYIDNDIKEELRNVHTWIQTYFSRSVTTNNCIVNRAHLFGDM
jgi:hypothetical protein